MKKKQTNFSEKKFNISQLTYEIGKKKVFLNNFNE